MFFQSESPFNQDLLDVGKWKVAFLHRPEKLVGFDYYVVTEKKNSELLEVPAWQILISTDEELISYSLNRRQMQQTSCCLPWERKNIDCWQRIMTGLPEMNVTLVDFLDVYQLFSSFLPLLTPWIGILHYSNCAKLFQQPEIILSLDHCLGLVVLSLDLAEKVRKEVSVPVWALTHPLDVGPKFNFAAFEKNQKVCHLGNFCRRVEEFLEWPSLYPKILVDKLNKHANLPNVQIIKNLPFQEYLDLISCSVVFIHLTECSACVVILECLLGNVPIIVNPLPAVIEYLGQDYPLYYRKGFCPSLEEIYQAHLYLTKIDKTCLSPDYFYSKLKLVAADHK